MDIHESRFKDRARLLEAVEVLQQLGEAFSELVPMAGDEDAKQAILAQMECNMAGMLVVQLVKHLGDGMEFYDALRATARGEMKLPAEMAAEWNKAIAKMNDPMSKN